jgi:hypothetical protein
MSIKQNLALIQLMAILIPNMFNDDDLFSIVFLNFCFLDNRLKHSKLTFSSIWPTGYASIIFVRRYV